MLLVYVFAVVTWLTAAVSVWLLLYAQAEQRAETTDERVDV